MLPTVPSFNASMTPRRWIRGAVGLESLQTPPASSPNPPATSPEKTPTPPPSSPASGSSVLQSTIELSSPLLNADLEATAVANGSVNSLHRLKENSIQSSLFLQNAAKHSKILPYKANKHEHVHASFEQSSIEKLLNIQPSNAVASVVSGALLGSIISSMTTMIFFPFSLVLHQNLSLLQGSEKGKHIINYLSQGLTVPTLPVWKSLMQAIGVQMGMGAFLGASLSFTLNSEQQRVLKGLNTRLTCQAKRQPEDELTLWWMPENYLNQPPQQAYWEWRERMCSSQQASSFMFNWGLGVSTGLFMLQSAFIGLSAALLLQPKQLPLLTQWWETPLFQLKHQPEGLRYWVNQQLRPDLDVHIVKHDTKPLHTFSPAWFLDRWLPESHKTAQALTQTESLAKRIKLSLRFMNRKIMETVLERLHPMRLGQLAIFSFILGNITASRNRQVFDSLDMATLPFHQKTQVHHHTDT